MLKHKMNSKVNHIFFQNKTSSRIFIKKRSNKDEFLFLLSIFFVTFHLKNDLMEAIIIILNERFYWVNVFSLFS